MKTAKELLRGSDVQAGFFSRRGEVLAPAAVIGFTMMGAILLSTLLSLWGIRLFTILTAVLGLACGGAAFFRRKGAGLPRADFAALFLLSAAAALLLAGNERSDLLDARRQFAGKEAEVSGTVSSVVRREDGGSSFLIQNARITAEDGTEGHGDVLFYADGELSFDGGEKVRLGAELSEELTLSQVGMGAELVAFRADYLGQDGAAFWHPLYALRDDFLTWAQARVYAAMPRESGNVMLGMLLGSREQLGSDVYALLQGSGLVHILSVSGLHIAVFFSLSQLLLRRAGKRAALLASIPLAGIYVFLTGSSVPSVRSFVMIAFLAVAEVLHRPKNVTASLGLAVVFFCITDPMSVVQVGTILSIVAVWCLYAVAPAIRVPGKAGGLLQGGAVSLAVSAVTLPVMAILSGYVPLLSPCCSILALPVMPAVLALGAGCIIFGGGAIGRILGAAANLLVEWVFFVSRLGDAGPKIPLGSGMVTLGCCAVAALLVLAALWIGVRKISQHRSLFAALAAFLFAVTGVSAAFQPDSGLRLASLEGVYVLQDGAQALVIGSGRSDYAGQTAAQYLRAGGVTDYTLLIPEGKMTFTGGSYELLTQFPPEQLIAAGNDSRLASALAFTDAGEMVPADGWSRWSLVGGGELEIRPGEEGPYLLFTTAEGVRFVLQDGDDPAIYGGTVTVYYDEGAAGLSAALPENKAQGGLLGRLAAGDECPAWGAGFTRPDWTLYLTNPVRVAGQTEGGEADAQNE